MSLARCAGHRLWSNKADTEIMTRLNNLENYRRHNVQTGIKATIPLATATTGGQDSTQEGGSNTNSKF